MARVIRPIEHNANYHEILGERLPRFFQRYGFDATNESLSVTRALTILDRSMINRRIAIQMIPPGAAIAWGKTSNNLREFAFLRRVLKRAGLDDRIFNLSYHRAELDQRMWSIKYREALRSLVQEYLTQQWPLSLAAVFQLINYVHAYVNWRVTFAEAKRVPRVLVLANDHSPNQAGSLAAAQGLHIPTIYIQHAEVTKAFPRLDFDISILRNQASLDVYSSVGPTSGKTHIVSREESPFVIENFDQATQNSIVVGVYLTAQVVWEGVRSVIQNLRKNAMVDSVFVKPHPSLPLEVLSAELPGVEIRKEFFTRPHVAVVANSSVVIELLHQGNVVFQHYGMDAVPPDYYGFSRQGIAPEVSLERLLDSFWTEFRPDEDWLSAYQIYDPWAGADYLENERQLAQDLQAHFSTRQNLTAAAIANCDLANSTSKANLAGSHFSRAMLQMASNTVVDYINEPQRYAPARWCAKTTGLDFAGAMDGIFADRVTNSYELFGATRRIREVASELVYISKRRDIELTGRHVDGAELEEIIQYVANRELGADVRWQYYIEFLMFLLRLDDIDRIEAFFSKLPPLPVKRLGINRRIAVAKWLRDNPRAQRALNLHPANLYSGLAAFQRLKLKVLSATTTIFDNQRWTHAAVEQSFLESASKGVQSDLSEIYLPCYKQLRDNMQFMEVRWSTAQCEAFYRRIETDLQAQRPFALIRLSDREAYMFADDAQYFTIEDIENCERHWWRLQLTESQRATLTTEMRQAAGSADVLGIPSIYRLLRETDIKSKSLMTSLQVRGLAEVARRVKHFAGPDQLFSEEKCNIPLFFDFEKVLRLCDSAARVVVVASASEPEARQLFNSIEHFHYIAIPTHSRTMSNHKYAVSDKALPEVYSDIRQTIANTVELGDLVIVAAGVIGKIFVADAKEAGGVALDVGTCLDSWVGARIHSLL